MRLLLTGGAGFIGSQLLQHLVTSYPDYKIVCADSLTYAADYTLIADLEGFAHGYATLSESATVLYKVDQYYNKKYDTGIYPLSESLSIDWGLSDILLSEKDQQLIDYSDFKSPF